ncbi:sensor histidine kinase [Anaerocolumna sp. MB42-C2]|uniref:sensor histidine kinase n=1 Tax=Anaerocolumna sp. MB42-C2 TaxID=3070997 RepID=UPI0027E12FD4|nr:sensor histidine kinase [Anaerocolumna sp. MB42-C2]WMJ90705.1 sensor histidine kinase [Anaerocolumna sp. MB42-C2]
MSKNLITKWFSRRSIRTKMTISFSIPLLLIALCLSFISYNIIANRFARQILYSADRSYEQTISYLQNHVQNMNYVLLLLGTNKQMQEVLSDSVFEQTEEAKQYREYWKLDEIIASIDLSNGLYNCALYVPDAMLYSNNNYHFFPLSKLPDNIDWKRFSLDKGGVLYFSDIQTVLAGNSKKPEKQVALLKMIYDTGDIQCVARVGVAIEELEKILRNFDITQKGFSYLVNSRGKIIASSSQEEEEYIPLLEEEHKDIKETLGWEDVHFKGNGNYLLRRQTIKEAGWTLVSMIEKADFYHERNVVLQVFVLFVTLIFPAIVYISYSLARYYSKRLTKLSSQMIQVQNGNWSLIDEVEESEDEIGRLFDQFKYMTKELRILMLNQYRLGQSVKSAELRALQAQINPHFLYNTLDLINWEARDHGAEEIVTIVQSLSKFYRISLNKGRQIVKIADEIEHIKAYVKIENYHFENAIFLNIDANSDILELGCINIILQPLVENAIMHGIAKSNTIKECHINIEIVREAEDIVFHISDDGRGMTEEQLSQILQKNTTKAAHGYGAQNINFRIKLYYGEAYGISYKSNPGEGTCVTVRIPALTVEEAEQYNTK